MWEWACGGVSIHEFCSAVTRVLLRSMIITVFRSFLKPYFLYKNTKSMLLLSRMPNKSKNTTMNIHFWHKCIISSVFPLEYGLIQAGGSPLCTGVCCRLHEYLHPRHEYGDLKKYWFGWPSFSVSASCLRKIPLEIRMPSICKQCGPQFPIRLPTPCNQKERKEAPERSLAFLPDQKWQRVEITY